MTFNLAIFLAQSAAVEAACSHIQIPIRWPIGLILTMLQTMLYLVTPPRHTPIIDV